MLEKIEMSGAVSHADRILIYGGEKVGKTTWAASVPGVLVVDLEGGLGRLVVPAVRPRCLEEFHVLLAELAAGTPEWSALAVDSLDRLEEMIWLAVCKREGWSTIESPGFGRGYVVAAEEWRKVLAGLDKIARTVILVGHAQIKTYSNPAGDDYARYELRLAKQAIALAKAWVDSMLFARIEDLVVEGKAKTGRRVIRTVHAGAWDAGSRWGLPDPLPLNYAAYAETRDPAVSDAIAAIQAITTVDELVAMMTQLKTAAPSLAAAIRDRAVARMADLKGGDK